MFLFNYESYIAIYFLSECGCNLVFLYGMFFKNLRYKICFLVILTNGMSAFCQPNTISGLALWLRADSGITLNGSQVSLWKDLSGTNNAIQANTTKRPILVNPIPSLNLNPVVRFSGDSVVLYVNNPVIVGEIFVVCNWRGTPSFPEYNGLITRQSPGGNDVLFIGQANTTKFYPIASYLGSNIFVNGVQTLDFAPLNQYKILSGNNTPGQFDNLVLGSDRQAFGGRYWNGDIAEIIIFDKVLSLPEHIQVEQYLNNKYAPPVNLGPDITVCSFPSTIKAKKDYYMNYLWQDASTADSLVVNNPGVYYATVTNIFGKISTDTIRVFKDTLPFVVNLGNDITTCQGQQLILTAGPSRFTYHWSDNSSGNAFIPPVSGKYWVSVIDCKGNLSSDTIIVSINNPVPVFNLGNDTSICYSPNFILNPHLGSSVSYLWSSGATTSALPVYATGKYWLKTTSSAGCIFSDTIKVQVDSFPIKTSLGPNVTICSGASIALIAGAALATNYLWSTGASTSSIPIITTGTYSLTVQNATGCTAKDSVHVYVKGINPVPNFIAPAACFGSLTNFTDQSTVALPAHVNQWNWNFGDGNNSVIQNPSHSYAAAGTYTTTLTVVSDSGCSATIQKTDTVHNKPNANFSVVSSPVCSGTTTHFSDQSSVLNSTLASWQWDFGDPASGVNNNSFVQNPTHVYNAAGTYTVQLIVTSNKSCSDTVRITVNVNPTPIPSFTVDTVCQGAGTNFSGASTGVITNWLWNFGDGNNSTLQNPLHIFTTAGTHNVLLTVTSNAGCMNSFTGNVMVNHSPKAKFVSDSVCVNAPLQFIDSSYVPGSSISSWNWQFGSIGSSTQQNPVVTFTPSGTYSVTLSVTSAQGCTGSSSQLVQVMPLPVPSFSFSPQYGPLPLHVNFSNLSSGASHYVWSFGEGLPDTSRNPSHSYLNTGLYHIQLVSETKFGCKDSLTRDLPIDASVLDVADSAVGVIQQTNIVQAFASLYNTGNIDVNSILLSAYLDDGNPVLETWTGTLTPHTSLIYRFISSFEILSSKKHNMVCVDVVQVNGWADDVLSNNQSCTAITNDFTLLNPFPNPTNDDICFLFILPLEGIVTAEIYDVRGRKADVIDANASKGLNQITYNTLKLSRGTYFLKLYYKEASLGKTFIRE